MSDRTCRERLSVPCHEEEPDLWFAESPVELERAKALCADCPIRRECLDSALERQEPWGVGAGRSSNAAPSWHANARAAGRGSTLGTRRQPDGAGRLAPSALGGLVSEAGDEFRGDRPDGNVRVELAGDRHDRGDHAHRDRQLRWNVHLPGGLELACGTVEVHRGHLLQPFAGVVEGLDRDRFDVLAQHVVEIAGGHLLTLLNEADLLHGRQQVVVVLPPRA